MKHVHKFARGILSAPVIDVVLVSLCFHFTSPGEQHCLALRRRTCLAKLTADGEAVKQTILRWNALVKTRLSKPHKLK